MNGRDGATAFLPLDPKIGGQDRDSHPTVGQYLTREQAKHIYKKVETGKTINVDTVKLEIEQEKQLSQIDDDDSEVNPYSVMQGSMAIRVIFSIFIDIMSRGKFTVCM